MRLVLSTCLFVSRIWYIKLTCGACLYENLELHAKKHSKIHVYVSVVLSQNFVIAKHSEGKNKTDLLENEPPYGKTNNLHMRKQRRRSASRLNREADQRLCFRYTDSTIPLLSKSKISSL